MKKLPKIIEEVGFNFSWDERKVWQLDIPVERVPIEELTWHFDVPFLWSKPDGFYDIYPRDVIALPEQYLGEYERTMVSDTDYPIDVMLWRGRLVILDGLHRLMKFAILQEDTVKIRRVPETAIPLIKK